jgi:hypothetical protein
LGLRTLWKSVLKINESVEPKVRFCVMEVC